MIVPVLNQEVVITSNLSEIREYLGRQSCWSSIVVVDSGSVDHTPDVVTNLASLPGTPIYLISCSLRGHGAAIRSGIHTSSARFVGFWDPSFPSSSLTMPTILPRLPERGFPVAVGARPTTKWSRLQGTLLFAAAENVDTLLARWLHDVAAKWRLTCTFADKGVGHRLLDRARSVGRGMEFEMLRLARTAGRRSTAVQVEDSRGQSVLPSDLGIALSSLPRLLRVIIGRSWQLLGGRDPVVRG